MSVQQQHGYTLVELVIVVLVLAVVAAMAVPAVSSNDEEKLELAAQEFAAAIRFARSESLRTREPFGFHSKPNDKFINLFRLDAATNPASLIYDVVHPINKSLYQIDLTLPSLPAADSLSHDIVYPSTCSRRNRIYFDANGTPWCSDPTSVLLESYELTLQSGAAQRTVVLDRVTGRVSIQ